MITDMVLIDEKHAILTGKQYKLCGRDDCDQPWKPQTLFYWYESSAAKDGLDTYCIDCKLKMSKDQYKRGSPPVVSTILAIEKLKSMGFPAYPGKTDGFPWGDIRICGSVPGEAKMATPKNDTGQVQFGLTPRQRSELLNDIKGGVLILIIVDEDNKRWFVVPSNDQTLIERNAKHSTAITFTPDSDHGNASVWRWIEQYENRWDIIEQARIRISNELKAKARVKPVLPCHAPPSQTLHRQT